VRARRRTSNEGRQEASGRMSELSPVEQQPCLRLPNQDKAMGYAKMLTNQSGSAAAVSPQVARIRDYLTSVRGLKMEVVAMYGVGCASYRFPDDKASSNTYVEAPCLTFPWMMSREELEMQDEAMGTTTEGGGGGGGLSSSSSSGIDFPIRRIKARAWERKGWQRLDPVGGGWGLFGLHTVGSDIAEVVLTEGEFDAMAVFQATGLPAVSLPNGASSLPLAILPLLERFTRIYLWMDNDAAGRDGAEKFARKLGLSRCFIVRPLPADVERLPKGSLKDANDCLRLGVDMRAMVAAASRLAHKEMTTFASLRSQVLQEIAHPGEFDGTPLQSLPLTSSIVKGVRKGELTVLTGPTGSGKTTLLSQLSLDLASQNVNTLWGSFEVKNTRLIKKMLQQFHGSPLLQPGGGNQVVDGINAIADRFQTLPLHFMTFHGGTDVDRVIDVMDFAVYAHDVEHVIIDNLQFMLSRAGRYKSGGGGGGGGFDKFDQQDLAIEKFRRFATVKNCHVSLVVHPRKEDEWSRLGLSSIFGGAKATQEADSVIILQNDGTNKYLDVKKNRYDGELGVVPLSFSKHTSAFFEDPALLAAVKQKWYTSGGGQRSN